MAAWASGIFGGPKNKKASADALTSVVLFALHGAQGGTRTRTLANYPLKVACLPVPPPGHVTNCRHNNAVRRFDSAHYKEIYLTVKNFLRFFVTRHANAIDKPFLELRHKLDKNLRQKPPQFPGGASQPAEVTVRGQTERQRVRLVTFLS